MQLAITIATCLCQLSLDSLQLTCLAFPNMPAVFVGSRSCWVPEWRRLNHPSEFEASRRLAVLLRTGASTNAFAGEAQAQVHRLMNRPIIVCAHLLENRCSIKRSSCRSYLELGASVSGARQLWGEKLCVRIPTSPAK